MPAEVLRLVTTTDATEDTVRHDQEAEGAVLGAVLLDRSVWPLVAAHLTAEDFHDPRHALVYTAMCSLSERGDDVDALSVLAELRTMRRINAAGGADAIGELTERLVRCCISSSHAETHARLVAGHALARRIDRQAEHLRALYRDPSRSLEDLEREATVGMALAARRRSVGDVVDIYDAVGEAVERLNDRASGSRTPTGFCDLDRLTGGGLTPGQLVIIAARPAVGKTAFGLCVASSMAEWEARLAASAGRPPRRVLLLSLEMTRAECATRLVAARAGISQSDVRQGKLSHEAFDRFERAAEAVAALPVRVVDTGRLRISELRAMAGRERLRGGLLAVVVDYLQLVRPDQRSDSREREVSEVARSLKELAKEVGCPVLAMAQLNRDLEKRGNKRPILADLRESGEIEQASDIVCGLYRDEVYRPETKDKGIAELIVLKHRNGPCDTVRLRWHAGLTRFDNLADDEPSAAGPAPYADDDGW